jgi:hypothetical protein
MMMMIICAIIMKYTNVCFVNNSVVSSVLLGIEDLLLSSVRNIHLKVMKMSMFL